jgi:hypothetical protein
LGFIDRSELIGFPDVFSQNIPKSGSIIKRLLNIPNILLEALKRLDD